MNDDFTEFVPKKKPIPNKRDTRDTRQTIRFFMFYGILILLILLALKEGISFLTHINESAINYKTMCIDNPDCHKY